MRESWRWFGPNDPVTLDEIRQTGATDIVSALHTIPTGEVWSLEAIRQHQKLIEECETGLAPLKWSVVESIPVHEDIKLARPGHQAHITNWITSMENLAACGIKTICYNFMPVILLHVWPVTSARRLQSMGINWPVPLCNTPVRSYPKPLCPNCE